MAVFKHIKSGKLYRKLSDKFMFKENGIWKKALVLYEALYQNPDSQHFSRTKEDFEGHFVEVSETEFSRIDEFEKRLDLLLEDYTDLSYEELSDSLQYYADMLPRNHNQS
jgi:hypothetical protein